MKKCAVSVFLFVLVLVSSFALTNFLSGDLLAGVNEEAVGRIVGGQIVWGCEPGVGCCESVEIKQPRG